MMMMMMKMLLMMMMMMLLMMLPVLGILAAKAFLHHCLPPFLPVHHYKCDRFDHDYWTQVYLGSDLWVRVSMFCDTFSGLFVPFF